MPILSPAMAVILSGYMSSGGISGVSNPQLSLAISNGFCQYAITGVTVSSIDVGAAGSGVGIGFSVFLTQSILVSTLTASFNGAKINGPMRQPLITAIAAAVSDTLKLAEINTINVGVGVGTGKVTLIPDSAISVSIMIASFIGLSLIGIASPVLASAIAHGIDQALLSAIGVIAITGPAGPSPGTGIGTGKIL